MPLVRRVFFYIKGYTTAQLTTNVLVVLYVPSSPGDRFMPANDGGHYFYSSMYLQYDIRGEYRYSIDVLATNNTYYSQQNIQVLNLFDLVAMRLRINFKMLKLLPLHHILCLFVETCSVSHYVGLTYWLSFNMAYLG